ncbi:MAG TPA: hypothetical protein VK469_00460 [Candidatus Kapabacteria bacterium]|nr:hypothetical protein [Candidatus Kapabacteria bacterium]
MSEPLITLMTLMIKIKEKLACPVGADSKSARSDARARAGLEPAPTNNGN